MGAYLGNRSQGSFTCRLLSLKEYVNIEMGRRKWRWRVASEFLSVKHSKKISSVAPEADARGGDGSWEQWGYPESCGSLKATFTRSGVGDIDHCQIKGRTSQQSVIELLRDRKTQGETGPFLMKTTYTTCALVSSVKRPISPYKPRIPLQTQNALETAVIFTLQAPSLFTQLPIPRETDTELGQD